MANLHPFAPTDGLFVLLSVEACATLLSRVLKRNLFNLFAAWCGSFSKPLGYTMQSDHTLEEEKLQFSALQAS